MPKMVDLDEFDRRLIELVRQNNLEPARELAEKVGLSISAVLRRLRRLRATGVIVADIAVVDPALTGSALTMHVVLRLKQAGRQAMDGFARAVARRREVTGAWEVTGEDDFILKVEVGSMDEYHRFIREVLDDDDGVLSFKTLITIREVVGDTVSRRPLL